MSSVWQDVSVLVKSPPWHNERLSQHYHHSNTLQRSTMSYHSINIVQTPCRDHEDLLFVRLMSHSHVVYLVGGACADWGR